MDILLILLILLVISIFLLIITFGLREIKIINRQKEMITKNNESIQQQILDWSKSKYKIKDFNKDELFAPAKMKNGEIDLTGLDIKIENYSEKTPWFIRK